MAQTIQPYPASPGPKHETTRTRNSLLQWFIERGLDTAVLTVSEFGRTAAENGSRGTDHGTGGIALLAGGAVDGGRIIGKWPGLSERALYAGRDLNPVNAYERLFKAALIFHLGLSEGFVEDNVFPDSSGLTAIETLFRTA